MIYWGGNPAECHPRRLEIIDRLQHRFGHQPRNDAHLRRDQALGGGPGFVLGGAHDDVGAQAEADLAAVPGMPTAAMKASTVKKAKRGMTFTREA